MWFFKELPEALKRVCKKDPATFWISVTSAVMGTIGLIVRLVRVCQ